MDPAPTEAYAAEARDPCMIRCERCRGSDPRVQADEALQGTPWPEREERER